MSMPAVPDSGCPGPPPVPTVKVGEEAGPGVRPPTNPGTAPKATSLGHLSLRRVGSQSARKVVLERKRLLGKQRGLNRNKCFKYYLLPRREPGPQAPRVGRVPGELRRHDLPPSPCLLLFFPETTSRTELRPATCWEAQSPRTRWWFQTGSCPQWSFFSPGSSPTWLCFWEPLTDRRYRGPRPTLPADPQP